MNSIGFKDAAPLPISLADPFNYPTLNRNQLMSMNTITNAQDHVRTQTNRFTSARRHSMNLHCADIQGATPGSYGRKQLDKPDFTNYNGDIAASQPRQLHFDVNKVDRQLLTNDIYMCQPQVNKFLTARKPSNPLNPVYNLPSVDIKPATPNKFRRDCLETKDIEGCQPRQRVNQTVMAKDILNVKDIPGAVPAKTYRTRRATSQFDCFNYSDVSAPDWKTSRRGNPLEPSYLVFDNDGKSVEIGEVEGSKPRPMKIKPWEAGKRNPLETKDILGAQADTKGLGAFENAKRQNEPCSYSLLSTDIPNAQANTLRRGITTTRCKHPLDQNYQYPGNTELEYKSPFSMTKKEKEMEAKRQSQMSKVGASVVNQRQASPRSPTEKSAAQKLDSFVNK